VGFLDHVTVVDATRLLPGGYCTMLLSDMGAKVVKVEQPGLGDYMRMTPPTSGGVSPVHSTVNRNKLSIGLDLKKEEGKTIMRKLLARSDVFVEGFRPGVMDRLGFSFEEVRKVNPRIVYCSISSFGKRSGFSSMPGHDINFQAMAGMLSYSRKPEMPMLQLGDLSSGLFAALSITAALARKRRGAVLIDVPITQSLLSLAIIPTAAYLVTRHSPSEGHSLVFGSDSYYNLYRTSDGRYMAVAAIEDEFWRNTLRELGLSHLVEKRLGSERDRAEVREALQRVFATRTRDEWARLLMGKDTCVTPVLSVEEALNSEWAREYGSLVHVKGDGDVLAFPVKASVPLRTSRLTPAPRLGEHTEKILRSLGYSAAEISRLREERVVE